MAKAGTKSKAKPQQEEQEERKLTQTKGSFKIRGVVGSLNQDRFMKEGLIEKGAYEGKEYKSTSFPLTSAVDESGSENTHFVELFGMELNNVYISKRVNNKFETKKIDFDDRHNLQDGWNVIGVRTKFDNEEQSLANLDAVQVIQENVEEGMSLYVAGEIGYRSFEDKEGNKRQQKQFSIKSISQNKEIDFENEDFTELASFEQEIVIVDVMKHPDGSGRVLVIGRVIAYNQTWEDVEFVIDPSRSDKVKKMATAFMKLKFGDFIKVKGLILNRVEIEETEEKEDDPFGGDEVEGYSGQIKNRISELQIISAVGESLEKKKYTEDDFVVEEMVQDKDSDDDDDDLDGDDDALDISDDDLPF